MAQSELTKEEKSWLRKLNNLLAKCPSDKFGFYTTGDYDVTVYDAHKQEEIDGFYANGSEFVSAVEEADARIGSLTFPNQVHSTVG